MRFLLCLLLVLAAPAWSQVIFTRDTDWGRVVVQEQNGKRILHFQSKDGQTEESRMVVAEPYRPVLRYVRQMLAVLAIWEANREGSGPYRFLVVGLGGASLSNGLAHIFPNSEVVSVEIEPAVVEAARRCFFYRESELVQTVVSDARAYLEGNEEPFDVIFLDAFDGTGVPPTLRTLEFAEILGRNLTPSGAVIANIHFTPSEPSLRYRRSLAEVFPHRYVTLGVAQGIGLFTRFSVSKYPLQREMDTFTVRYGLPLDQLLDGRHQESLEGVVPFRD